MSETGIEQMQRTNILVAASIVLVTISGAANVAFLRQNAALRTHVNGLRSELQVTLNVPMPELSGTALSGSPYHLDVSLVDGFAGPSRVKILFVLSPTCRFCASNWPRWHDLLKERGPVPDWHPVFVNVGPPIDAGFAERHEIGAFDVFQSVSASTVLAYRFYGTPQTMVLDRTGRVRGVWKGVLAPEQVSEIRSMVSDLAASVLRWSDREGQKSG